MLVCNTDGTAAGTQAAVGSKWNILEKNIDLTNIAITGGTIDGATIGGTTPAAGTFTTLKQTTGAADGAIPVSDVDGDLILTASTGIGAPVRAVSPALTGTPTAPTATTGTNTTQLATTAFVQTEVTAVGIATVGAADRENVIEDLSYLPPVTATWDPGNLVDGAGETSAAIPYPGVALGLFTVEAIAPYDLEGITCNAWVDAANSVKARLQNETAGTIDLASGTWTFQARRI